MKVWYALGGFKAMFEEFAPLDKVLEVIVDGKTVSLPPDLSGLMVINIPSYAGGADLWGKDDNSTQEDISFLPPSICDQMLEVVGVTGSFHMGACTVNLSRAIRVAQGGNVSIYVKDKNPMPMQMDGEPWIQPTPFALHFKHKNTVNMLSNSSEAPSKESLPKVEENSFLGGVQQIIQFDFKNLFN